jgi:hypothetical protein
MAFSPIAFIAPNYSDYGTYWLKAYLPGSTTPKALATDSAGTTTFAKVQLNVNGFFKSAGGALITPYVEGAYDAYLFETEAEADANNTASAIRLADNITPLADEQLRADLADGTAVVNLNNELSQAYDFVTFYEAINFTGLVVGKVVKIKNRNGVSSTWDAVLASSVTPNTNGIVLSVGSPTVAIVLRNKDINTEKSIAEVVQTTSGFTDLDPSYIAELKALGDISSDTDSVTIKRKGIKAWKRPKGIKDGAAAASFNLSDGLVEPGTEVSGFPNVESIGIQTSRDAVALFGQNISAPPTLVTSSTTYTLNSISSSAFVAVFDDLEIGMICDVNFGGGGWVGAVILSKTAPSTLNISSWRNIDGVSGLATTPSNGAPLTINRHNAVWGANFNAFTTPTGGANQAIGIEVGLSLALAGSNANSKGYLAVNLGGEAPEYGYTLTGSWLKGYTSTQSSTYGFGASNGGNGFVADAVGGNSFKSTNPTGNHFECRDAASAAQVIIRKNGKFSLGTNAESGLARLNVRGDGTFTSAYDETEFNIFDPTTTLASRSGFFIAQTFAASSVGASFTMGVGNSSTHTYDLNFSVAGTRAIKFRSFDNHIEAGVDNTQTFGRASFRWSEIFAANGTINTSDEREKTALIDFTEKERSVAIKLKSLLKTFKWLNSVKREESGGSKARIHVGIGAQSLGQAFTDEGLNPDDYAMFCYDEWQAEEDMPAGDRYGVRLDQVSAFIIANT